MAKPAAEAKPATGAEAAPVAKPAAAKPVAGSGRAPAAKPVADSGRAPAAKPAAEVKPAAGTEAASVSTASAKTARVLPIRLTQAQAAHRLKRSGLSWKSTGGCVDRTIGQCTSLDTVRRTTVASVIALKRASGCPIVITGGTEVGHAPGRYSHAKGYKLDIQPNSCVNDHIIRHYPFDGIRDDGAPLYRAPNALYARELDHWDILFFDPRTS
ncbi:hypothetical protein [Streptosporangium sandarakinum]|uniref:Uncharacterized protein n=1 Tax=Streptosporangium sandarakinum TaxID=1260955 RepID=A0A852V1D9_9ACTN|nr:hypothetical protein [Streptosporangium sandarakinum]NYF41183.1 hypothetical protein [Streptosporangium sandarakinum]